ncbi:unnamed protein product, partial [Mesorhabditis belari]|uniref:Protein kinase domain-containing protein n=1 Tax=Mesorhabditis belari TaxID=2138241 RepID=A0AAF3J8N8_9BILA
MMDKSTRKNGEILSHKMVKSSPCKTIKAQTICFSKGDRHEIYKTNFADFSSVKTCWKRKESDGWMQIGQLCSTLNKIDDEILRTQESIDLRWERPVILGGYGQISTIEMRYRGLPNQQFIAKNAREGRLLYELRDEWNLLPELVLILEKCCDENLKELISNAKRIYSMYTVVCWAKQLFSALDYLHEERLIHGDIKTKNILLTERKDRKNVYDVKLCDFGVTVNKKESVTFLVRTWEDFQKGTLLYMSPEAFDCLVCHRSDIFCLGLVLWEMIERRNSYLDEKKKQREPPIVCCIDNEKLRKLIFDCTRISYKERVKDAKFVLQKLEPMLEDYETRLNLSAEVKTEESETILRPPIGFDGERVKGEYPRDDLDDLLSLHDFENNDQPTNYYHVVKWLTRERNKLADMAEYYYNNLRKTEKTTKSFAKLHGS